MLQVEFKLYAFTLYFYTVFLLLQLYLCDTTILLLTEGVCLRFINIYMFIW